jgi:hypothetical protein
MAPMICGIQFMDLRDLVEAILRGDLQAARQWVADAHRKRVRWDSLPCPRDFSRREMTVAAGLVEPLATRSPLGCQPSVMDRKRRTGARAGAARSRIGSDATVLRAREIVESRATSEAEPFRIPRFSRRGIAALSRPPNGSRCKLRGRIRMPKSLLRGRCRTDRVAAMRILQRAATLALLDGGVAGGPKSGRSSFKLRRGLRDLPPATECRVAND